MDAKISNLRLIAFSVDAVSRLNGCVLGCLIKKKKEKKRETVCHDWLVLVNTHYLLDCLKEWSHQFDPNQLVVFVSKISYLLLVGVINFSSVFQLTVFPFLVGNSVNVHTLCQRNEMRFVHL